MENENGKRKKIRGKRFVTTVIFRYSATNRDIYTVVDSVHDHYDQAKAREMTIREAKRTNTELTTGAFEDYETALMAEVSIWRVDKNL